ncbi:hypothetical protein JCM10207_000928 [Rhodosporidiobolus poonsookiae]
MVDTAIPQLIRAFYHGRRPKMGTLEARTVGQICSSLEVFNHKRALDLCNQRLKTNPSDPASLVLKLLCLYMSSKPLPASVRQEMDQVIEKLKTANKGAALGDADVLSILMYVLRGLGKGDEALELLAAATQKHPDNEELANEAFLAYIRVNETKGAQQVSMRMAKQFKDERYLWWSLLSVILQIRNLSRPHPQADLLLSLAERQLSTHYATANTEFASADEFHVVTRLLELRAQYAALPSAASASSAPPTLPSLPASESPRTPAQALLAHLGSEHADKWCERNLGFELWKREALLQYGTTEGNEWEGLWTHLRDALEKGDTNWHTMLYLVRAAFSLAANSSAAYFADSSSSSPSSAPSPAGLETISRSRELFRKLATDSPKAKVERGFVLGLLEIARELRGREWEEVDAFLPLVEEYFDRFAAKMCCFDDLYPYLDVLTAEETSSLRDKLAQQVESSHSDSVSVVIHTVNALKVVRLLADEPTAEIAATTAADYLRRYFEALPLGAELPATELQHADDFALLACEAFVNAFHLSHDRSYLERALVVAETALSRSKYKYQMRILASNILRQLGAPSLALAHHRIFGVKNVQYDTLSHLVVGRGATFAIEGNVGKEGGVFEYAAETERWYKEGCKEAQEMVVKALNYGTHSKVEDFAEFRLRLDISLQRSLVTLETLRMRVIRGVLDSEGLEAGVAAVKKLVAAEQTYSDNRDYKTLPNFQRKGSSSIWEQTELGPRQDSEWLHALAVVYSRFLRPSVDVSLPQDSPSSLTRAESALLDFSQKAQAMLVADLDNAAEVEQAGLTFFKGQSELFVAALEDPKTLPWEVLQIAAITLEAFSLLELGIDQRLAEMATGKLPDQPRHTKRLRAFRANARDLVRSVGAKLTAYSKKVAKEKTKVVAAVADLKKFEQLDDKRISDIATALVEARRTAAEGLGAAIHRRSIK